MVNEFVLVKAELEKYDTLSKNVHIIDDDSLVIAENNAGQVNDLIKRTEAVRKALGDDYYNTWTQINAYAKTISEQLKTFKERMGMAIANWKTVQEAAKRAELESTHKELEAIEAKKKIEVERIVRLTNTVYAKLYGGTYFTKTEEKIANGCTNISQCEVLSQNVYNFFPKADAFEFFPDRRDKLYNEINKAIRTHTINLTELQSDIPGKRSAAQKRINQNRLDAGFAVQKTDEVLTKKVEREVKKGIREGEKEVKAAAKGTRKTLKFKIDDESLVPREFLSVDEVKIRNWMEGQHDKIKDCLKNDGDQPVSGVQFYVEITNVAR